jgi:hypothetical protein
MQYVMVPVPSDYVLDLMRWLQFQTEPEQPDEDAAALQLVVEQADEVQRALLVAVADASIEGRSLRLRDAADEVGLDSASVRSTLLGLDARALGAGRTLVKVLQETFVNVRGKRARDLCLTMRPHHARVVRATVRRLERTSS